MSRQPITTTDVDGNPIPYMTFKLFRGDSTVMISLRYVEYRSGKAEAHEAAWTISAESLLKDPSEVNPIGEALHALETFLVETCGSQLSLW
jgi:hypothetical protein